jgi:hypothetical protein
MKKISKGFTFLLTKQTLTFLTSLLLVAFSFTTVSAQPGKALNFDGINDYVSLPFPLSGDYTKEAWINASSTTGFPNIISGNGTALYLNGGILTAGNDPGYNQVIDPGSPITAGTWHHVAVTYNATTMVMNLYKDGSLVATAAGVPAYTETALTIGQFAGGNNFNGLIDEVRIWKSVRSASEIAASKDCELTGNEPNLLAYYKFNQGLDAGNNTAITTLTDDKVACITDDGVLNNFALTTGSTSNFVGTGAPVSGTCANFFSNINVTGNGNCIALGDVTPSTADFTNFGGFGIIPVQRTFVIQNTGNATLNLSSVTITGANAADFSLVAPGASISGGASENLVVTFSPSGGTGLKNATITINNDDVDEAAYTFAISGDYTGPGQALAFDGFDDRVDVPLAFTGDYTKEAWINNNTLSGFPNILSGNSATGTALFLNNGQLAAGHGPAFTDVIDPTPLVTGQWYHVAVTYNATTNTMRLYKDGVQVAVNTAATPYTETALQIGALNSGNYFWGNIDEVRIWNVEKTASDIANSMSCELNGTEAGLLAYYNFNQGAQGANNAGLTILNDVHGNCPINAVMQNFALSGTTSNWVSPGGTLPGSCTAQVSNISVSGNSNCITIGDITPNVTDNTDFGVQPVGSNSNQTFVIHNNGGAALNISSVTITGVDASSFVINTMPATTVLQNGDSTILIVTFAPSVSGIKNANVVIANNDADEASYTFAITGNAQLVAPVTLLYFNAIANGNTAKLSWQTGTEVNNSGFNVQRSADNGLTWKNIGFVKATNFATGSKYSFIDQSPLKGVNAYRISQVDIDGKFANSNTALVNFSGTAIEISVYPNPVKNQFTLVVSDNKLLNTKVKITSASGALISVFSITNYSQPVDVSNLADGIYFISFSNGTVQRIIKQ